MATSKRDNFNVKAIFEGFDEHFSLEIIKQAVNDFEKESYEDEDKLKIKNSLSGNKIQIQESLNEIESHLADFEHEINKRKKQITQFKEKISTGTKYLTDSLMRQSNKNQVNFIRQQNVIHDSESVNIGDVDTNGGSFIVGNRNSINK